MATITDDDEGKTFKCYNCGEVLSELFKTEVNVTIKSSFDNVLAFHEKQLGDPSVYHNDSICPSCVVTIAGILNKNVLRPDLREKGVPKING